MKSFKQINSCSLYHRNLILLTFSGASMDANALHVCMCVCALTLLLCMQYINCQNGIKRLLTTTSKLYHVFEWFIDAILYTKFWLHVKCLWIIASCLFYYSECFSYSVFSSLFSLENRHHCYCMVGLCMCSIYGVFNNFSKA